MPNPENLIGKGFKPGQSGNPSGKPPGTKNRSTIARKVLEMRGLLSKGRMEGLKAKFPEVTDSMTVEEIMTIVMAENAITGDDKAYKAVMDSAYGAPKQDIDHTTAGEKINIINLGSGTPPDVTSTEAE